MQMAIQSINAGTPINQKVSSTSLAAAVNGMSSLAGDNEPNNPNPSPDTYTDAKTDTDTETNTDDITPLDAQDKMMAPPWSGSSPSSSSSNNDEDNWDEEWNTAPTPSTSPPPPTATVANSKPWMSSVAVPLDNGTAITKPSIASTMPGGGVWAMPSGAVAPKNGTLAFRGTGNALVPVNGVGLFGLVIGVVLVGVL